MQLTFLEARMPLIKKYTATTKHPYPNAYEFKSHTYDVNSLNEMYTHIVNHAKKGHCLLKGKINKQLDFESRAGSTTATDETYWLCFDCDGITSVATADDFMARIGLSNVSYILHWSSSYMVNGNTTFCAHLYVLHAGAISPDHAKLFLKHHNLATFDSDLCLTRTKAALRWGLDVTTCQNDKLLYISDPHCEPPTINQFTGQRIQIVNKPEAAANLMDPKHTLLSPQVLRDKERAKINELRKKESLPERKATQFEIKDYKGQAYMPKPDEAIVTGCKSDRGFTYLNLNHGDSWGYYHPDDNPTFIFNFKGEPAYKTKELLPSYWENLNRNTRAVIKQAHKGKLFLAFRDFRSAAYYNGWYDQQADEVVLHPAKSERQLEDFLANYGQPVPEAVPIWNIVYDPDPNRPRIDTTTREINVFKPSDYMVNAKKFSSGPTPTINKVLQHVVGKEAMDYLINWIAYIFQERASCRTAWVLHGVQGTGKGILMNHILTPLFGSTNVVQKRTEELEDKFNDWLEKALVVNIDEAEIAESGRARVIMANLKNHITEPTISVRRMRQTSSEVRNYANFIFSSNKRNPVVVEASDRRFNVGEYQTGKLDITDAEIALIKSELEAFAYKLHHHKVDKSWVRTPMYNDAKRVLQEASKTSADLIGDALNNGDLSVLWDALPSSSTAIASMPLNEQMHFQQYQSLLHDLVKTRRTRLTRDELYIIYEYNVGKIPSSPIKFSTYLKHHEVTIKNIRINGKQSKGVDVNKWNNEDKWFEERCHESGIAITAVIDGGKDEQAG